MSQVCGTKVLAFQWVTEQAETVAYVQEYTANPRIDSGLGIVGR